MNPTTDATERPTSSSPPAGTLRDLSRRSKALLLLLAGVLASTSAALTNIDTIRRFFAPSGARLVIDEIDVIDDSQFPYIEVLVRNRGDKVALITSATITIDDTATIPRTLYGKGLSIDEEYHVTIPVSESLPVSAMVDDLARKIDKDDVDRIRIRYELAPQFKHRPTHLCAFRLRVELTYNEGKTVTSEPLVAQNNAFNCVAELEFGATDDKKALYGKLIEKIENMQGTRTAGTDRLIRYVRKYVPKTPG